MQNTASAAFHLEGNPLSVTRYGSGHINETYLIITDKDRRYILQKINHNVFSDVPALMDNISRITAFLADRVSDPRECLHIVPTLEGKDFLLNSKGEYWRVYDYITGSICLQKSRTPEDFYQSAVAFGHFQRMLADFPAETLHETIPDFHNTPDRYRKFHEA